MICKPRAGLIIVLAPLQLAACIFFTPFFTVVYNQERLILKTIYVVNKEIQGDSYVATRSSRNHLVFSLVCTRQLSSLVVNLTITLHWDWLSCLSRAKEGAKWSAFSW